MPTHLVRFIRSAGAMLLVAAVTLLVAGWTRPPDLSPVSDPLFHCPLPGFYLRVGVLAGGLAILCLWSPPRGWHLALISGAALAVLGGRGYVAALGLSAGFKGYLADGANVWGIRASTAEWLLLGGGLYGVTGGMVGLWVELKRSAAPLRKANL